MMAAGVSAAVTALEMATARTASETRAATRASGMSAAGRVVIPCMVDDRSGRAPVERDLGHGLRIRPSRGGAA